jgi:hypothetical protein
VVIYLILLPNELIKKLENELIKKISSCFQNNFKDLAKHDPAQALFVSLGKLVEKTTFFSDKSRQKIRLTRKIFPSRVTVMGIKSKEQNQ